MSVADLARLNAESLRQRRVGTFLARRIPGELRPLAIATAALYPALAAEHGAQVVVDSSKSPAFFAFVRLLSRRGPDRDVGADLDVSGVHLLRDPRGVVDSWSRDKLWRQGGWSEELRAKPAGQAAREWLGMNAAAELVRVGPRVRFESFAADPEAVIRTIAARVGLDVPTDGSVVRGDVVHVRANHAVGGNVDRFAVGETRVRSDEGWRERISPATARRMTPLARMWGYH